MKQIILVVTMILLTLTKSVGQGYVDQDAVESILNSQNGGSVEKVAWKIYQYNDNNKNDGKGSWTEFLAYIDSLPGSHQGKRRYIVEMANRVTGDNFRMGRELIIPTSFPEDYRAYSPYPLHYDAAAAMPKLYVIDKHTQTFGAYENGNLVRWGIISSGEIASRTPRGRYNFNWKDQFRLSSAAPAGEVWKMYWVFNFHAKYGIHVHQYALPIGYPASHGCVRLAEADAKWNFDWANGWIQRGGRVVKNGTPVIVIGDNPDGRPAHWSVQNREVVSNIELPSSFESIPLGSEQQRQAPWASGR